MDWQDIKDTVRQEIRRIADSGDPDARRRIAALQECLQRAAENERLKEVIVDLRLRLGDG